MARENPVASFRTEELLAHRAWLYALSAKLVRDQAERDDLVQETWLAALRHPRGDEKRDLGQWLAAILRNRWRFERRSDARRRARERAREAQDSASAPASLVEQAELQGALVRAVLALEDPYRATVLQRYFGERTCRAIARAEGAPEGTVRSRLKRALDLLRAELDRASVGERRAWILALVPLARLAPSTPALTPARTMVAAVAAVAVVVFAWNWARGDERRRPELSVAPARSTTSGPLAPVSELGERAPLTVETAVAGAPAPLTPARLELLVLDPDGQPIPEASVVCGSEERKRTLRTDEHGACRIPDAAWSSGTVELEVTAPGFVRHDAPIERGSFSWRSPYAVYLPRAVALEGRLRDADTGRAIEGAELTLAYGYRGRPLARAASGAEGLFRLEPAPRGWEVELLIRAPGHAPSRRLVQVSSAEPAHLELALTAGVELGGRIVDAWTGAPLVDAVVFHDANGAEGVPGDGAVELARSDAGGDVVLRIVPDEELPVLLFFHPGYCSVRQNPRTDGFEIALLPAAAIEGILRDGAGRPVSGSEVILDVQYSWFERLTLEAPPDSPLSRVSGDTRLFVPVWRAHADEQGRFRMEVVPGLASSKLFLQGALHPDEHWTLELPLQPGETRQVDIQVRPAGTLSGLLRINGEPSPGRVSYSAGKYFVGEWTRPDGSFEIRGVPPGPIALKACPDEHDQARYMPGYSRTHPVLAEVEVVAGQTRTVELDLALPMGTIRGRVTSASGEGRGHTSVVASAGRGNGFWRALTDADGSFELRVPAEQASYELRVQGGPPVPVPLNADGIELVTTGHGRVRLRAEDAASHARIERVTLFIRRGKAWESAGEFSAGTNGFAQWELEAGTLELAAGKPEEGYPVVHLGKFTLGEHEDLELGAVIERVDPTRFVLVNPPLPGACGIRIETVSGLPTGGGMFGGGSMLSLPLREGHASVLGLPKDTYRVSASLPNVVIEPAEIRLGPDRSRPIEFSWRPRRH